MKKIIICLILSFVLIGCGSKENEKLYDTYVNNLKEQTEFQEELPFDVNIYFDKLSDNEIRYQVVIDNTKENIYDIKAIAIHDYETSDIFPSIGIVDEKIDLIQNSEDVKGVKLVGYIDTDIPLEELVIEVRLLVEYINENGEIQKLYYRSTK